MKLPTTTFNTARTTRQLAKQIGGRIVRDKQDAARQGFEVNNDLFSRLREHGLSVDARSELTTRW
jgi:hypothetical protein